MQDLGLAYRKAKVDIFYSSHPCLGEIAAYEDRLHENLTNLKHRMESADESWVSSPDFIGSWTAAAKTVNLAKWRKHREEQGNGLIFSSPLEEWNYACDSLANQDDPVRPEAEFRIMSKCSIDFHVLSTLWLLKVGEKFDRSKCYLEKTSGHPAWRLPFLDDCVQRTNQYLLPISPTW